MDKDGFQWSRESTQPSFDNHSTRITITSSWSNLTTPDYCGLLWGILQCTFLLTTLTGGINRSWVSYRKFYEISAHSE